MERDRRQYFKRWKRRPVAHHRNRPVQNLWIQGRANWLECPLYPKPPIGAADKTFDRFGSTDMTTEGGAPNATSKKKRRRMPNNNQYCFPFNIFVTVNWN